jgi:hypothetical protein
VNTNSLDEMEEPCNWRDGKPRVSDPEKSSGNVAKFVTPQKLPPNYARSAVVFLGDYVDRGKNSLEVILLLLLYRLCYPTCVYLTRGVL